MAARSGKSYVITAEQHALRALTAAAFWAGSLGLIFFSVYLLPFNFVWTFCLTFGLWVLLLGETIRLFMVGVPEVTGLIAINLLKSPRENDPYDNQIVFPTGLWFKFPWEQVKDDLYINLRSVTQEYEEDFPAFDGPEIHTRGVILYRPDERLLPRYIAVDSSVINRGLVDIATGTLSHEIAQVPATTARGRVDDYQQVLLSKYEDTFANNEVEPNSREALIAQATGADPTFEWLFGIDFLAVRIGDADYDDQYQTALAAQARQKLMDEDVQRLIDEKKLHPKDALNAVLINNKLTTKDIFELEGDASQALAALLASLGRGFGGGSRKGKTT